MICKINCFIAIVFIVANIWFHINISFYDESKQAYVDLLTKEQQHLYKKIIKERSQLSLMGYVYGFILACGIIGFNYMNTPKYKLKVVSLACLVVSTTFLTQYFYYILSPKKYWMLETDMTLQQQKGWLYIYKIHQWQYHFGLLIGILAVIFLSMAFKC